MAGTVSRRNVYISVLIIALLVRFLFFLIRYPADGWAGLSNGSELGQIAANLAEGRGFSSPFDAGAQPTAMFAPLVVCLWAAIFQVFGAFTTASLLVIGFLQSFAGALACVVFTMVGYQVAGKQGTRKGWVPPAAGMLLAVWPESVIVQALPWYFVWQELGTAVLFLLLCRWMDFPDLRSSVAIGFVAGMLLLVNPVPLPFIACSIGLMTLRLGDWQSRLRHSAVVGGLVVLIVLPWTARNYMVFHKLIPLRSNFGIELRIGNNEDGSIRQTSHSLNPSLNAVELQSYQKLGEVEYASVALASAAGYIKDHPLLTLKRTLFRGYVYWCSDIFNVWPWTEQAGREAGVSLRTGLRYVRAGLNILPVVCLVWFGLSGRLRGIPFLPLFVCLLVCMPLPYYLTHVNECYAHLVKPYMILLCLLAGPASKQEVDQC